MEQRKELRIAESSTLPPAQPAYIFRGHSSQIHAVHFLRGNLRLLSGDAEGWVILWSIPIKRPVAVWKPHSGPILGLGNWGEDNIITHGRDNKLRVWQLRPEDEAHLSTVLPVEDTVTERPQPWMLHSLAVNALNFCAFAICQDPSIQSSTSDKPPCVLIATPGVQDGCINVTSLPSEDRIATIPSPKDTSTGMIMAIGLIQINNELTVVAGYESGHAVLWQRDRSSSSRQQWEVKFMSKSHTQPILSLSVTPDQKNFFTSSADAIIAKYLLPLNLNSDHSSGSTKTIQTKHAGQQSLSVRSDGKIFATTGWDGRLRVYSPKTMKELAVLKWHKEGCYALAFAEITDSTKADTANDGSGSEDSLARRERALTVSEQRTTKAASTHWLAGGSKDGKISLWDIY